MERREENQHSHTGKCRPAVMAESGPIHGGKLCRRRQSATAQDWANASQNRKVQDRNSTDFPLALAPVCSIWELIRDATPIESYPNYAKSECRRVPSSHSSTGALKPGQRSLEQGAIVPLGANDLLALVSFTVLTNRDGDVQSSHGGVGNDVELLPWQGYGAKSFLHWVGLVLDAC